MVGPLAADELFDAEDFALLEKHALSSVAGKLKRSVAQITDLADQCARAPSRRLASA